MKRSRPAATATTTHDAVANNATLPAVAGVTVVSCTSDFPINRNKNNNNSNSNNKRTRYDDWNNSGQNTSTARNDNNNNNNNSHRNNNNNNDNNNKYAVIKSSTKVFDWNETVREVQNFSKQYGFDHQHNEKIFKFGKKSIYGNNSSSNSNSLGNATISTNNPILERKAIRIQKEQEYEQLTGRTKKHHSVPLPIIRGIKKKAIEREQQYIQEIRNSGTIVPINSILTPITYSNKQVQKEKKQQIKQRIHNDVYGPAPSIGFMKHGILRVKNNNNKNKKTLSSSASSKRK